MKQIFSFSVIFSAVAGIVFCVGLLFAMLGFPGAKIELTAGAALMAVAVVLWAVQALGKFGKDKGLVIYTAISAVLAVLSITMHLLGISAANPLLLLTFAFILPADFIWIAIRVVRKEDSNNTKIYIRTKE